MKDPFLEQLMYFQAPERQDYVSLPGGKVETIQEVRRERRVPRPEPKPQVNVAPSVAQSSVPNNDAAYEKMMNEILAEKRGSIEGIQKQIDAERAGGHWSDKLKMAPVAAWVDSMTGSNMSQAFQGPSPAEKRQAMILKLGDALQKQKDDYADQALGFFKNKAYMDQVKAQMENAQADREFDRWYKREKIGIDKAKAAGKSSKGMEALDKAFAKTYEEEFLSGKVASAESNLEQLNEVGRILNNPEINATGGRIGWQPLAYRKVMNPESANSQQIVENVVQQSLKAILGAQFTEKEAARLIERAYDPGLEEQYNAPRVARLYAALKSGLERKKRAAKWFQQNGTMQGFDGVNSMSLSASAIVDDMIDQIGADPSKKNQQGGGASRLEELRKKQRGL